MSTQLSTKNTEERNQDEQTITPNGALIESLVSADETEAEIGLHKSPLAVSEQKQVPVFANPNSEADRRALQQAAVLVRIKLRNKE
jgi:hypothetical protein